MVYGVQDPQALYNKYGVNGFYNQYGLYNNQSPSLFGNGYASNNGDDGKISFTEKAGSFVKGIGKSIWNGIKSLATPSGLLKTAATIGACMIPGIGPLIGLGLAGIGVVKGVSTVAKGVSAAASATTDEQARQAWENIGSGTFTTVASAVAVKGATKAVGQMNKAACGSTLKDAALADKITGTVKNAGKTFSNSKLGTSVINVGKAFKNGEGVTDKFKEAGKTAYKEAKAGYKTVKTKYAETKQASRAAADAKKDIEAVESKTAAKKNFTDEYKYDSTTGKYTSNKGGEALEVDAYKSKIQEYDSSINDARHSTALSVKKANQATQKAKTQQTEFENKFSEGKTKFEDGVEYKVSNDGNTTMTVKDYNQQITTLKKNKINAETAYDVAKKGYENARKATNVRKDAIKIRDNKIASANKLTDVTARNKAIEAANTEFNNTIKNAAEGVSSQAAKNALRGETSMPKAISNGFTRNATANGWDTKDAGTLYVANQLEEANSEYEMYNEYLKSIANSNGGYSA